MATIWGLPFITGGTGVWGAIELALEVVAGVLLYSGYLYCFPREDLRRSLVPHPLREKKGSLGNRGNTLPDGEMVWRQSFVCRRTLAFWLGSSAIDGARAFDGVTPTSTSIAPGSTARQRPCGWSDEGIETSIQNHSIDERAASTGTSPHA